MPLSFENLNDKGIDTLISNLSKITGEEMQKVFLEAEEDEKKRQEIIKNTSDSVGSPVKIELPKYGKLISLFAKEVADVLKDKGLLFYRTDSKEIVEIGEVDETNSFQGFKSIKPNRMVTLIEKHISPGNKKWHEDTRVLEFKTISIKPDLANTLLQSDQLQRALPRIERLFSVPIPIIYNSVLTFPKKGYDARFKSWMPLDAPEISNPNMPLDEAKSIIDLIYAEFCFEKEQDKINAIAGLLTPFLKGLFNKFNSRTPIFFYKGNRERSGKDYCAGITGIVYEGFAKEESPISTGQFGGNNTEELRKHILSAFLMGRKRMHFSNNKGHIDNAVMESVSTAETYSDRLLGRNEIVSFNNELDFSLSGNLGVSFTADLANRCRFVNLFLEVEDANARNFANPHLHNWLKANRSKVLSALYSLVRNWYDLGKPTGKVSFSSFPNWAEVCGGIMESAGYSSPCSPNTENIILGGDDETMDMKALFELCFARHPNEYIEKREIISLSLQEEIFGYLNFSEKKDLVKFGMKLTKFTGRILSGIKLTVQDPNLRNSRQRYKFIAEYAKSSH